MQIYLAQFYVFNIITRSNSTLLSGELATLLTGYTVEFEVLPFSFCELKAYLELNNKSFDEDYFYNYLKWGGFPLRFDYEDHGCFSEICTLT